MKRNYEEEISNGVNKKCKLDESNWNLENKSHLDHLNRLKNTITLIDKELDEKIEKSNEMKELKQ